MYNKISFGNGSGEWYSSVLSCAESLQSLVLQQRAVGNTRLRMSGAFSMRGVILNAIELKERGLCDSVELCSPILYRGYGGGAVELGCQGGYRPVVDADKVTLSLWDSDDPAALLVTHPCWKYWSFLGDVNLNLLARVVGKLCDPRYYVDSKHPDRSSKFYCAMGKVCTINDIWIDSRDNFLAEAFYQTPGYLADVRRVNRRLAAFLRYTWLDVLESERLAGRLGDSLFCPDYFFKDSNTAARFRQHANSGSS